MSSSVTYSAISFDDRSGSSLPIVIRHLGVGEGLLSKLQETTDISRGLYTPDIPATLPVESGLPVQF